MQKIKRAFAGILVAVVVCISAVNAQAQAMGAADAIAGGGSIPFCPDEGAFSMLMELFGIEYTPPDIADTGFVSPEEMFWTDAKAAFDNFLGWCDTRADDLRAEAEKWVHTFACGRLLVSGVAYTAFKEFISGFAEDIRADVGNPGTVGLITEDTIVSGIWSNGDSYKGSFHLSPYKSIKDNISMVYVDAGVMGTLCVLSNSGAYHVSVTYGNGKSENLSVSRTPVNGKNYYSSGVCDYTIDSQSTNLAGNKYAVWDIPTIYLTGVDFTGMPAYEVRNACYDYGDKYLAGFLDSVSDIPVDTEKEYPYDVVGGLGGILDRDGSIGNLDLVGIGSVAGADVIDIPWTDVLTDDRTVADIAIGENTVDDVREMLGVAVVDSVTEKTISDDEARVQDMVDIIVDPAPIQDFTAAGIASLFPFCLPFDLIDFINCLSSAPEAPRFKWPIRYKAGKEWRVYEIDIDLSKFDSVARIVRDMECLVFIVALISITRAHMIKG